MFMFKKNQVVITALVVMIAAAGYLNYMDSVPSETSNVMLVDGDDVDGVLVNDTDEAVFDDSIEIAQAEVTQATADVSAQASEDTDESLAVSGSYAGEAVFVSVGDESSYFIQAKLEREQSRAKQKDLLNEMLNNDKLDNTQKSSVADQMLEIQKRIEKETAAEAMIEAKGFDEVYVRIDDDTVDVVVDKAQLTDSEVAQIEDIVKRKTGVDASKIRISPLRSQQGKQGSESTTK
jgi:stage III sporulation protein AH